MKRVDVGWILRELKLSEGYRGVILKGVFVAKFMVFSNPAKPFVLIGLGRLEIIHKTTEFT